MPPTLLTTLLATSAAAYVVLRAMCFGPFGPRLFLSLTAGLIAAGGFSFVTLVR